jgi:hypothetical protein
MPMHLLIQFQLHARYLGTRHAGPYVCGSWLDDIPRDPSQRAQSPALGCHTVQRTYVDESGLASRIVMYDAGAFADMARLCARGFAVAAALSSTSIAFDVAVAMARRTLHDGGGHELIEGEVEIEAISV